MHHTLPSVPGAVPNLRLPDTFTLHFTETKRNVRTPELQARINKLLRRSYDSSVKDGKLTQEQADHQFALASAPPPQSERFDVTVSGHDGKLFYKRINFAYPDQAEIVVYDGVHGLVRLNENQVYITQDLDCFQMCNFPLPGLGLAQVPLLKADTTTKASALTNGAASRLQGEIPLVANSNGRHGVLYTHGDLSVRLVDGKPQALDMGYEEPFSPPHKALGADGKGFAGERWTYSNHRLFAGVWIAGQIRTLSHGYGFAEPLEQVDYHLLDVSSTPVDESQFTLQTWIEPNSLIRVRGKSR
jgi:hypothetical protein